MSEILDNTDIEPLKALIKERGLKVKFIAQKLGIMPQALTNVMCKNAMFKTDTICALAAFFEVPVSRIVRFTGFEVKEEYKDRWKDNEFYPPENPEGLPSYLPMRELVDSWYMRLDEHKTISDFFNTVPRVESYLNRTLEQIKPAMEARGLNTDNIKPREEHVGLSGLIRSKLYFDEAVSMSVIYNICKTAQCDIDFILEYR